MTVLPLLQAIDRFKQVLKASHLVPFSWHNEDSNRNGKGNDDERDEEDDEEDDEDDEAEYQQALKLEHFDTSVVPLSSALQKLYWLEQICDKYPERTWIDQSVFQYTETESVLFDNVRPSSPEAEPESCCVCRCLLRVSTL